MKGIAGCINILGARAWRMCVLKLDKEEAEARGGGKSSPDPGEGEPLWAVAANALCSEGPSEPTAALRAPCIYTLTSRLVVKNIRSPHRKLEEPCALSLCITSFTQWRSEFQLDLPFLILITSLSTWCSLSFALCSKFNLPERSSSGPKQETVFYPGQLSQPEMVLSDAAIQILTAQTLYQTLSKSEHFINYSIQIKHESPLNSFYIWMDVYPQGCWLFQKTGIQVLTPLNNSTNKQRTKHQHQTYRLARSSLALLSFWEIRSLIHA